MSEFISEELKTILAPHYELNRDKPEITRVDRVPVTIEDFEELAKILPFSHKLELAENKFVIMPISARTGQREANLITEVTLWCRNNHRIVGLYGSSQTCYNLPLPNPTVRGPDASVVLTNRWNVLSQNDQNKAYPSVAPNFVAEIRSDNDSEDYCHQKMLDYIDAGVEEGILIDPITQNLIICRVDRNGDIVWNTRRNPRTFTSRILNGFILNLRGII